MNDKVGQSYLPTKAPNKNLSCVLQKSLDFVGRQFCRPTKSSDFCKTLCRPTFCIPDYKFCLCCHGDCLQWKM